MSPLTAYLNMKSRLLQLYTAGNCETVIYVSFILMTCFNKSGRSSNLQVYKLFWRKRGVKSTAIFSYHFLGHTFSWCIEKMDSYLPLPRNKHGQKSHGKNGQRLSPSENLLKLLVLRSSGFFSIWNHPSHHRSSFLQKTIIVG